MKRLIAARGIQNYLLGPLSRFLALWSLKHNYGCWFRRLCLSYNSRRESDPLIADISLTGTNTLDHVGFLYTSRFRGRHRVEHLQQLLLRNCPGDGQNASFLLRTISRHNLYTRLYGER